MFEMFPFEIPEVKLTCEFDDEVAIPISHFRKVQGVYVRMCYISIGVMGLIVVLRNFGLLQKISETFRTLASSLNFDRVINLKCK